MPDARVAQAITKAATKWNTKGITHASGDSVPTWWPVDKTSVVSVRVPYLLLKQMGTTTDKCPDGQKVYQPAPRQPTTGTNRRRIPVGSVIPNYRLSQDFFRIWVALPTPITWTRKGKQVVKNKVGIRIPSVVPIAGCIAFLWQHSDAGTRPAYFETVNQMYRLQALEYTAAELGEMSDKAEMSEAKQIPIEEAAVPDPGSEK